MTDSIFKRYREKRNTIARNKNILQTSYIPDQLPHRSKEIDQIASVIAAALSGEKPSNMMIFGKTGTGKTAVMKYIGNELKKEDACGGCEFVYINCQVTDTHYGILYTIGNPEQTDVDDRIPYTGWSTEKVFSKMREYIDSENKIFIIVLDEIDKLLIKSGNDVLHHLLIINENLRNSKVSIVGISNNLKFTERMDSRVHSRFGGENMVFEPYTSEELEDILRERVKLAFDEGSIEDGVIAYCAALSARETGDARRALDFLRVATDIAERNGDAVVTEAHVKSAKNKIEMNIVIEAIKTLTSQSKTVLMSIVKNTEEGSRTMTTGDVYTAYKSISDVLGTSVLTQRRVTDLISELDMLGIIYAPVRSYGKAGRTKEIELSAPKEAIDVLKEDELMKPLKKYRPPKQTTLM